jgi:nitrate reductase gamma subunit
MRVIFALVVVLALFFAAMIGVQSLGLYTLFGVLVPYAAIVVFLVGVVTKVVGWARAPVPFRIPTTCGQQRSLSFISSSYFDNPHTTLGVLGRMILEVLCFRSLFRNTEMSLRPGPKVVYGPTKWLWMGGMLFHYSMLAILLRHLRLFTEPVPSFVLAIQSVDGFLQVGLPVVYATSVAFLIGLTYLLARRLSSPQLRYISLTADYFPLFLLLAIATTGVLLRHFAKTDIESVKQLTLGLLSFSPKPPTNVHYLFYVHVLFVSTLFAYFPFSKLMHMAGVFLSPTRNLANNSRAKRHINPWNPTVKVHTYAEYEDEFRERMVQVGLPVEKS